MRILLVCLFLFSALPAGAAQVVLVFGDSLSAAYGIPPRSGWVALLEQRLAARKPVWQAVNASVSGETTAGGLARLPAVLDRHRPDIVVIELGANDGLRGLPLAHTRKNLSAMIAEAKKRGARVLLVGMRLPPNYGSTYTGEFQALYQSVAKKSGASLAPFLFEGFAARPDMFQADGLHPTAEAQPHMMDNVWRALAPMLKGA
jgi:acyl-CoA thioesterase-1